MKKRAIFFSALLSICLLLKPDSGYSIDHDEQIMAVNRTNTFVLSGAKFNGNVKRVVSRERDVNEINYFSSSEINFNPEQKITSYLSEITDIAKLNSSADPFVTQINHQLTLQNGVWKAITNMIFRQGNFDFSKNSYVSDVTYQVDKSGRIISADGYYNIGNQKNPSHRDYFYDEQGRLVKIVSTKSDPSQRTFFYDQQGQNSAITSDRDLTFIFYNHQGWMLTFISMEFNQYETTFKKSQCTQWDSQYNCIQAKTQRTKLSNSGRTVVNMIDDIECEYY